MSSARRFLSGMTSFLALLKDSLIVCGHGRYRKSIESIEVKGQKCISSVIPPSDRIEDLWITDDGRIAVSVSF
jgi:hypothetical protein